jgi:hypothetical protein
MNSGPLADRALRAARFLVATLVVVVIAACSSPAAATPSPSEAVTASPIPTATAEPTATTEPTATAVPTEVPTPAASAGVGARIKVGDQHYVTIVAVEQWPGEGANVPAAGNVFLTVNLRIDAISTTSFTWADFTVEDVDGTSFGINEPGRAPHLSFQDGLEPGHFYAGFVTFEVPDDVADALTLVYNPAVLDETFEIPLQ